MTDEWIVSICEHGKIVAVISSVGAEDDDKREFALFSDRIEMRPTVTLDGGCADCRERYHRNCAVIGVEP